MTEIQSIFDSLAEIAQKDSDRGVTFVATRGLDDFVSAAWDRYYLKAPAAPIVGFCASWVDFLQASERLFLSPLAASDAIVFLSAADRNQAVSSFRDLYKTVHRRLGLVEVVLPRFVVAGAGFAPVFQIDSAARPVAERDSCRIAVSTHRDLNFLMEAISASPRLSQFEQHISVETVERQDHAEIDLDFDAYFQAEDPGRYHLGIFISAGVPVILGSAVSACNVRGEWPFVDAPSVLMAQSAGDEFVGVRVGADCLPLEFVRAQAGTAHAYSHVQHDLDIAILCAAGGRLSNMCKATPRFQSSHQAARSIYDLMTAAPAVQYLHCAAGEIEMRPSTPPSAFIQRVAKPVGLGDYLACPEGWAQRYEVARAERNHPSWNAIPAGDLNACLLAIESGRLTVNEAISHFSNAHAQTAFFLMIPHLASRFVLRIDRKQSIVDQALADDICASLNGLRWHRVQRASQSQR